MFKTCLNSAMHPKRASSDRRRSEKGRDASSLKTAPTAPEASFRALRCCMAIPAAVLSHGFLFQEADFAREILSP